MFLNFTNHPSSNWSEDQKRVAEKEYGKIMDLSFPNIAPDWTWEQVKDLAEKYVEDIAGRNPKAVLCQGEFTFAYQVIKRLKEKGILVVAATSERCVVEEYDPEKAATIKKTCFKFVRFREY